MLGAGGVTAYLGGAAQRPSAWACTFQFLVLSLLPNCAEFCMLCFQNEHHQAEVKFQDTLHCTLHFPKPAQGVLVLK